jgi:hypothetical protein
VIGLGSLNGAGLFSAFTQQRPQLELGSAGLGIAAVVAYWNAKPWPPTPSPCLAARRSTFTPALAFPVLTPVDDIALDVLGFGRSFKAAVAELAEVKPVKRCSTWDAEPGRCSRRLSPVSPRPASPGSIPTLRCWP